MIANDQQLQTTLNPIAWKVRLVRNLYERGFSQKDVRALFRLIDWLMVLPPALNNVFWQDVDKIQEGRRMPVSRAAPDLPLEEL